MNKSEQQAIESAIKDMVKDIAPAAVYGEKYGGLVIIPDPKDDKHFVAGIFAYKEHMSLEFSDGASFRDPDGLLEGSGKKRRHLKLQSLDELSQKNSQFFLKQAFDE